MRTDNQSSSFASDDPGRTGWLTGSTSPASLDQEGNGLQLLTRGKE